MILRSLSYCEFEGEPREWCLQDLQLREQNLIVGKNATGKSRAINVIWSLARSLYGKQPPASSGRWDCLFIDGDNEYHYTLACKDKVFIRELLKVNNKVMLDRGGETGDLLHFENINNEAMNLKFQVPSDMVATFARQDPLQHSFLMPLVKWGESVRLYRFGDGLGKNVLFAYSKSNKADERADNTASPLLMEGLEEFGDTFRDLMKNDISRLGYPISNIDLCPPSVFDIAEASNFKCISIQESDLQSPTDQSVMSNGLYRAVALLVHVNLALLRKSAMTILIDDIGEGLDFERSVNLITLLREKAKASSIELIMTSNDRFVMNAVTLEDWTVLRRKNQQIQVCNYSNSQLLFDKYKETGLSNFSFFEISSSDTGEQVDACHKELSAEERFFGE